jgi:urea transport system ATP-binding protein
MTANILEIEDLSVSFSGFRALNQLNFALQEGELRVIIGPNGAGKTTFLDIITGKTKPTTGRIRYKNRPLGKQAEYEIARLGVGRKFQTPRVFLELTVRENLELSYAKHKGLYTALRTRRSSGDRPEIDELIKTVGLVAKSEMKAGLLSHGEKQWLEIGMLVAQSPELLLLDEPVAGLSDAERELTADLLNRLASQHTLIVIEHDMEFVRRIARHVTVLHEGSVLCEGSLDEVRHNPRVIEVYLGSQEQTA